MRGRFTGATVPYAPQGRAVAIAESVAVSEFLLDPRLEADSVAVGEFSLSTVRLMKDSRFPWLILVPRRPDVSDLIDLPPDDRVALSGEVDVACRVLKAVTGCDKLNVASLGNVVRQLHVHVIARFEADAAWPNPVWGVGTPAPYAAADAARLVADLRVRFGLD